MSTKTLWTAEMREQLPDDSFRYELDDGELIKMSPGNPTHGQVGAKIISIFQGSVCSWRQTTSARFWRSIPVLC
jgi:Uma2 family endonuclease